MRMRWMLGLVLGVCFFTVAQTIADDWPQWRGPERNGISQETGLLKEWPEGGPKQLWKIENLGGGYSTPAIVGDRLYMISNEGLENEFVKALKVEDGSEVWSTRIGKVGNPDQRPSYPGARSTPTVDGQSIFAIGSDGDFVRLDTANGKVRWQKNLRNDFGGKPGEWAYSESPLVDGDKVVCTPGGDEATLVALNKNTGDLVWKCAVPGGDEAAYASIVITEVDGVKQYVQFLQNGIVGVDAESGTFLWRYDGTGKSPANIPTPVTHADFVYSGSGRGGAALIKLTVSGDKVETEEVYKTPRMPTSIGGSVHIGEHLYGTNGQGLICAEFATGEQKWQDRSVGAASVCFAEGMLYLHGENGEVALVEATPEEYREKGRFKPEGAPDRTGRLKAWAYPALANGRLYIHDAGTLWCYDVKR